MHIAGRLSSHKRPARVLWSGPARGDPLGHRERVAPRRRQELAFGLVAGATESARDESAGDGGARGARVRLRQAVLVAAELEPAIAQLRGALGLGEPYRDPGVGEFGLANAVFALGDCFLEVVSPVRDGTAAGRYLQRTGGDGGYMVIFDVLDLDAARARAAERAVRVVWQLDLPDISGTHLHPRDIGGAIVSIDRSRPYGSWRWGGPDWTGRVGVPAPGALAGVSLAVADPARVASLWAHVLGVSEPVGEEPAVVLLDGAQVGFHAAAPGAADRLVEIAVELPALHADEQAIEMLGVRLRRCAAPAPAGGS